MSKATQLRSIEPEIVDWLTGELFSLGALAAHDADKFHNGDYITTLAPDGSTRCFLRIRLGRGQNFVAAYPASTSPIELAEARSAWEIGTHLLESGVPVPRIFGYLPERGLLLFEDMGDTRLYDLIQPRQSENFEDIDELYQQTVKALAHMQFAGSEGFQGEWCYDTPCYDRRLMVERESKYFIDAFVRDFLGESVREVVLEEIEQLAEKAAAIPAQGFLHRDFQSRNIMVQGGNVFFIDFQGGRLGPPAYDLASLLIDPYAGSSIEQQDRYLKHYSRIAKTMRGNRAYPDEHNFLFGYNLLVQRNLQIIGAFSFLSKVRKKQFFTPFIKPALHSLEERLALSIFDEYCGLRQLIAHCRTTYTAVFS